MDDDEKDIWKGATLTLNLLIIACSGPSINRIFDLHRGSTKESTADLNTSPCGSAGAGEVLRILVCVAVGLRWTFGCPV